MIKKLNKDLYNLRFAILLLVIYCIFMQVIFGTVCPFKALTGIPCPGCGLTHATIYFFTGNFRKAFDSNPTFILWIGSIFLLCFDRYIYPIKIKIFPIVFSIVGIITIMWYFFRYLWV